MNSSRIGLAAWIAVACLCSGCVDDTGSGKEARPGQLPGVTGIRYLAGGNNNGFLRARSPRNFTFPADYGAHPGFRTEWWYLTGNLDTPTDRHFGFELTFFRVALAPDAVTRESAWSGNSVWMAHFALTDPAAGQFRPAEKLGREALGLAGAVASPFRVWLDDWQIVEREPGVLSVEAGDGEAAIYLELRGLDRIVLQGDAGLDRKGPEPGNASFYYSAPRLSVTGRVMSSDGSADAVSGTAWLDREWSTSALSPGIAGWDWFALQLDDGRDLMFYRLRQEDGGTSAYSGGSITDGAGNTRRLAASEVELQVLDYWQSASSGVVYPVAWRMRIASLGTDLVIEPFLPNQELNLSVRYWEGAVRVLEDSAAPRRALGRGYLELAGY